MIRVNIFRWVSLAILAGILAAQLYFAPPIWWTWFLGPLFHAAWVGAANLISLLSWQEKISLVVVVALLVVTWKFLRRWGTHVLLAAVVMMLSGMGLMTSLRVLLWALPAIIIARFGYYVVCRVRARRGGKT